MNGEDTLDGGNGHDLFLVTQGSQRVLGGPDIDTVAYNYPASGFAVDRDGVIGLGPLAGSSDHLENVERARFAFSAVAFDLEGNAGNAARMVGAVLGPQALGSASIADLALDLYDSGLSNADVAQLAVDGLFAGHSDEAFIGSLFRNILHVDPSATQLTSLVNLLAQTTRSDLLVRAASSAENESSIGFAGLEAAGWWYIL